MPCCSPRNILYRDLAIRESDTGFIEIYDFDPVCNRLCTLLKNGYMSVEDAKAWIDGRKRVRPDALDTAHPLYDDGWRAGDKDVLMTVHGISEEDAEEICEALRLIED